MKSLNEYLQYLYEAYQGERLFHISHTSRADIKIMIPKIPENEYVRNGWEDGTIPRISFALDVDHCILALGFNTIKNNTKIYKVYEPSDYSKIKVKTNKELIRKDLVPDAKQTKEVWVLNKIKVNLIAKIQILSPTNRYKTVSHGPNGVDTPEKYRRAWFWNWKLIEGEI